MFDDTQSHLEKIISLVNLCPERLQEKCFELLLGAYLDGMKPKKAPMGDAQKGQQPSDQGDSASGSFANAVPEVIKTRFNSLVARTKSSSDRAAEIFDFNVDPFTYHALSIPGSSNRDKMRNMALLLALKGYLTSANWMADWKEFRAACMDHSCWDPNNVATAMKYEWFKNASAATNINLSPSGIKAADLVFAKLAGGGDAVSA